MSDRDELQKFFAKVVPKGEANPGKMFRDFFDIKSDSGGVEQEQKAWEPFLKIMPPYQYSSSHQEFFWHTLPDQPDPNIGWKCHLNLLPEHAKEVSQVLKQLDLSHKFLLADALDGKIFTVYLGSKSHTQMVIPNLYEKIGNLLLPPKASGEVSFAPNMVGRFVGGKDRFATKVAFKGITLLEEDGMMTSNSPGVQLAWERADQELRSKYGDYYGGSVI